MISGEGGVSHHDSSQQRTAQGIYPVNIPLLNVHTVPKGYMIFHRLKISVAEPKLFISALALQSRKSELRLRPAPAPAKEPSPT